jgi:LysR family hca operon transcriptional activator
LEQPLAPPVWRIVIHRLRRCAKARGVELTAAGKVFLDHARLALLQVEAAAEGARRAGQPEKPALPIGFLAGQEVMWLRIMREEAPGVEITLSSQSSAELAAALMRGKLDLAFLRRETQTTGLSFRFLAKEPLIVILPADHRLATRKKNRPKDLAREIYINPVRVAPVLKSVIDVYAATVGITLKAEYDAENLSAAMSLVASTGGMTLFPLYVQNMLTPNVVVRALEGKSPTIDLMLGYNKANSSSLLKRFLSRADELVANVQKQSLLRYVEAR